MTQDMSNKIMTRNKMGLRLVLNDISLTAGQSVALRTARASRYFSDLKGTECGVAIGSCLTTLRLVVTLLLMMFVGVSEMKADDYSGVYYIANSNNNSGSGYTPPAYSAETPATNWYLVPAKDPQQRPDNTNAEFTDYRDAWYSPEFKNTEATAGDPEKPFLTTHYITKNDINKEYLDAIWIITSSGEPNYYFIIHAKTGKYVIFEPSKPNDNNNQRKSMHLQTPDDGDYNPNSSNNDINKKFKFKITAVGTKYNIEPKSKSGWYWNTAGQNADRYYGTDTQNKKQFYLGLVGVYNNADGNSVWYFEDAILPEPIIAIASNAFNITSDIPSSLPNGCSIRYTTGDGSQDAPTATTGELYNPLNPPIITDETNVKAAIFGFGKQLSTISNAMLNQTTILSDDSYEYNGLERAPTVIIKYGDNTIPAEEYDVDYSDNTAAGTAIVTVTNKAGGNFYVISDSKQFTISKAPLTITAKSHTITYGDAPANEGVTPTGLVNNETMDDLSGTLSYVYNYTQFGDVGEYTITPSGLSSGNYDISFVSGTLTVNKKALTINAEAKSKTYGEDNPALTYSSEGLVNNDAITGALTRVEGEDVGTYAITQGSLTASTNYDISYTGANLTINPKAVTVTSGIVASDKTYDGTTAATLDGTAAVIQGKIGSDDLTVEVGSGTFEDKNVGTDKIVTINSFTFGGTKAGNYQMAATGHQATAQASITPATLTVTAEAKSKGYGDDDPELTYTSDGLIGSDAITGALTRETGENVGTYPINLGTLTAGGNYSIAYTGSNLTISAKSIGDGTTPATDIVINIDGDNNVTVTRTTPTSHSLTQNTDFTVSDSEDEGGNRVWTITGINNYTGSAKVMRISLTFSETGEASGNNVKDVTPYMASTDMDIAGLDAWIVTHINMSNHKVTLQKLDVDYVPKDVPVLLLTDLSSETTEGNYTATPKYVATPGDYSANLLKKATSDLPVAFGEVYKYYQGRFVLTTDGILPAGSFYLDNPNPRGGGTSGAPLLIEFDVMTDIADARWKMDDDRDARWYTLDGRRLSRKPAKKGLYIMNGQKIVIK